MSDFTFILKCGTVSNELPFVVLEKRYVDLVNKL